MLVKPRYFEHGNQPSLFGSRDLVPVMPRLGVWHPSAKNRGFGTPGSVQAPNYGESRGLVPRFLPTSAIWFLASGETPGRDLPGRLLRVPNLEICPTTGTKLEISPRKGTKPRDPAAKTALRGTKPPKLAEARCQISQRGATGFREDDEQLRSLLQYIEDGTVTEGDDLVAQIDRLVVAANDDDKVMSEMISVSTVEANAERRVRQAKKFYSEVGFNQGYEAGEEQGLEQGLQQGLEQGLEQGKKEEAARISALINRLLAD